MTRRYERLSETRFAYLWRHRHEPGFRELARIYITINRIQRDSQRKRGATVATLECERMVVKTKNRSILFCKSCGIRVPEELWENHVMESKLTWLSTKYTVRSR